MRWEHCGLPRGAMLRRQHVKWDMSLPPFSITIPFRFAHPQAWKALSRRKRRPAHFSHTALVLRDLSASPRSNSRNNFGSPTHAPSNRC